MEIQHEARQLLTELDRRTFSCTAYDTAWAARVITCHNGAQPYFPETLDWLRQNQNPDGSWGSTIEYFHDRVISTCAAIIALTLHGREATDPVAIQQGEHYLHRAIRCLDNDPYETVGFELIFPTLVQQARRLGLDLPYTLCGRYDRVRSEKLQRIPSRLLYSRQVTSTHSLEFMGDALDPQQLPAAQEPNGSFGNSPSATAYVLSQCGDNPPARRYLAEVLAAGSGAAMPAHTVEIFNKGWVLYNLDLAGLLGGLAQEAAPHLAYLDSCWDDRWGVGFAHNYPVPDLDDSAVTYKLLTQAGRSLDPAVFSYYEKDTHFSCYSYERNASTSANIHLLDTLSALPDAQRRDPQVRAMVAKLLAFLRATRQQDSYWCDKWHISPFYVTAHAVIATLEHDPQMAADGAAWILRNQHANGAWGAYRPTSEETAYCLQALAACAQRGLTQPRAALETAAGYLDSNYARHDYPSQWIEKCLYTPQHIVQSAVISALALFRALPNGCLR